MPDPVLEAAEQLAKEKPALEPGLLAFQIASIGEQEERAISRQ